jgi:DNA-binding MarR family transcriptional regulator
MNRKTGAAGSSAGTRTSAGAATDARTDSGAAAGTGTRADAAADTEAGAPASAAERVWRNLRTLVLEQNEGRKETVEALGMSFFRVKALRRIAAQPSRMSELAAALGTDRPYLTLVVDDLVRRGLVERHQDPADRRSKIVTATGAGRAAAARADAILGTPPAALRTLSAEDLAVLDRITSALAAVGA